MSWTTQAGLTMLAHAVADRRLSEQVKPLVTRLTPIAGNIANLGQCGMAGPVALGLARLAVLADDIPAARGYLRTAAEVASRSGGIGALLHTRLIAAQVACLSGERLDPAELRDLAERATRRGMTGVARAAAGLLAPITTRPRP